MRDGVGALVFLRYHGAPCGRKVGKDRGRLRQRDPFLFSIVDFSRLKCLHLFLLTPLVA